MTVVTSARGFDTNSGVKAAMTRRARDISGNLVKIKADSFGIPDSSIVDGFGHQLVHFEVGPNTLCVSFPVEALRPA